MGIPLLFFLASAFSNAGASSSYSILWGRSLNLYAGIVLSSLGVVNFSSIFQCTLSSNVRCDLRTYVYRQTSAVEAATGLSPAGGRAHAVFRSSDDFWCEEWLRRSFGEWGRRAGSAGDHMFRNNSADVDSCTNRFCYSHSTECEVTVKWDCERNSGRVNASGW